MFKESAKRFLETRYPGLRYLLEYSPKTHDRREILRKIMNFVSECRVEGDYLEFGVYKGATFVEAYKVARAKGLNSMRFLAFDSFQGLPVPQGIDTTFDQFRGGQLSSSLDDFKNTLLSHKVDWDKVSIIPGWFSDALNEETKKRKSLKSAAVVWIDCDLYESAALALGFVTDLIVDGTVVVLDDWFFYKGSPELGERRAFREWLDKNPEFLATEFHKYSWHGNSFIIHRSG